MKRNIVKHGPSTLTISLPAKWVKKNNLKPGSSIEVEEKGNQLLINSKKQDEFTTLNIDIKNNYKTGIRYINSAHRKGCDELTLSYQDSSYLKRIEQCLSEDILGFEIVKQGKNFCVIRDIPGTKFEEFDILLERVWMILISISQDVLGAIKDKDQTSAENITALDKRINKFTNFCIRILNKKGHPQYKNIPVYYRLLRGLEELSDHYKYLLIYSTEKDRKISKNFIGLLEKNNEFLRFFHKAFYKPKDEDIEYILIETRKMYSLIVENCKKNDDQVLNCLLFSINDKIRSLLSSIVELNILN